MSSNAFAAASSNDLTAFDILNLFSAAVSTVLAIVALALSIFFFAQSKRDAERSAASANEIHSSVERLEKIFDSLYADTFSMMRETVTDMRAHVWTRVPQDSSEAGTADEELDTEVGAQQAALLAQISEVSRQVGIADGKISQLRTQLEPLVSKSLKEATGREHDARSDEDRRLLTLRIQRMAQQRAAQNRPVTLVSLARALHEEPAAIVGEVFDLGSRGILTWEGAPSSIDGAMPIRYVPAAERRNRAAMRASETSDGPDPE